MAADTSLPPPSAIAADIDALALADLPPDRRQRVEALLARIDIGDSHSIIAFGVEAQRELTAVSEQILEGVRNKDAGPAGTALGDMMMKVRELDVGELKNGRQPGWFSRVVLRRLDPLARFIQRYETVRGQVDRIHSELEGHRLRMVQDIARLDRLYELTLEYFHDLGDHVAAAAARLRRVDDEELPALKASVERGGDVLAAQRLADLSAARADLERKLHDLRLTRQVTMQSLPSIRLNQDLDKTLVSKIQSVLLNTLPLWKNQLAQAVTVFRTQAAAGVLRDANVLTNRLLEANAETLRNANVEVRQVAEQGVFGIDSIERANQALLATIQDSLRITEEGRQRRREAETRLAACETALKQSLSGLAAPPSAGTD